MTTIWKFPLINPGGSEWVRMPKGAKILCVQVQNNAPYLWAEVHANAEPEERLFSVVGTGWAMTERAEDKRQYVGTFQIHGGELVFHVYELQQ